MSSTFSPVDALTIPEVLHKRFDICMPYRLVIAGEANEAESIGIIQSRFGSALRFHEMSSFVIGGTALQVLSLPYGKGKSDIRLQHPSLLGSGSGLNDNATDALFVGPERRKIKPESAVWVGRALASSKIEHVFYLGGGVDHIEGLIDDPDLVRIEDPFDCIRARYKDGTGEEIAYSEALGHFGITIEETIR